MADSQKKSANIINAAIPSETAKTTVTSLSNGGIELSISNATWTQCRYTNIPVVANVEYTLSIYIDEYGGTGTFMIPFKQIDGNGTVISTDTITQTGTITHTFTAEGSTVWLAVYLNNSGTAATATAKIRIMLNEGATALPYEPYSSTGWVHSLRKLTTATEAIENPLYSDGTAITAYTLKGNTVQSGTPTPSNPVPVVGVGELETTGEHTGEYKTPISSGGVTTNIYLGSTQTVRQIYKYVCTGDEDWSNDFGASLFIVQGIFNSAPFIPQVGSLSTHYTYNPIQSRLDAGLSHGQYALQKVESQPDRYNIAFKNTDYTDTTNFKAYLAQQYANGTPVSIWYVLATAETGTVNEPLMKIGDYADTLSNATSIPTTEGANTISVDTTVQPSEFTATWTGWHDASVKEWDGSDWS